MICLSLPIIRRVLVRRASASSDSKRQNLSKSFLGFFSEFLGRRQGKVVVAMAEEIQKACYGDGKGSESCGNGLPPPPSVLEDGKNDGISAVIPGWFSEISPMWPGMKVPCCSALVSFLYWTIVFT